VTYCKLLTLKLEPVKCFELMSDDVQLPGP